MMGKTMGIGMGMFTAQEVAIEFKDSEFCCGTRALYAAEQVKCDGEK